ncbi:FitA-like ribbon-helix-helix domain-containing protein [Halochromatium glycolicum]|jgi:plasmid stability protein|nr:plasmid stabilization protein [Halochromatium glycolicum]
MLTIRNLDDALKHRLRVRAAHHGHSMEEEARASLRAALVEPTSSTGLGSRLHARVSALCGGGDLPIPARSPPREPPLFEEDQDPPEPRA